MSAKNKNSPPAPFHQLKIAPLPTGPAAAIDALRVEAPSLDGLEVVVPAVPPPTQSEVVERFRRLKREVAEHRPRAGGDAVAMGDDVQVDIVGLRRGEVIPFSFRNGLWMELAPVAQMPGVAEAIAGEKPGEKVAVDLTLPNDFSVAGLRGERAQWVVHLIGGESVERLDDASPKLLERLKRGKNLDEVLAAIIQELVSEQADALVLAGENLVLDQLAARVKVDVKPEQVDTEIATRWQRAEGDPMRAKGFSAEMIDSARRGWLSDASVRADAERRLRISAVVKAVAERDRIEVTPATLTEVLARHVPGVTPEGMHQALNETVDVATSLANVGLYLLTVEHVMRKATVTYEGAKAK